MTIIRAGCKAVDFNFEYFTTRSLVKKAPNQRIEIRKQIAQNSDFNIFNGKIRKLLKIEPIVSARYSTGLRSVRIPYFGGLGLGFLF